MPLAAYKDLCIDAVDPDRMTRFWAAALGLAPDRDSARPAHLEGHTEQHGVWINGVPEPRTVKQRVHLDVVGRSVEDYELLGATVLDRDSFPWTVMADPEGGEFCVFVRAEVPDYRMYELGVDCVDPGMIAGWWAEVLGGDLVHDDRGFSYIQAIPGAPFDSIDFVPVPERKTVKNRIHWDVDTAALDRLSAAGATVLRHPDAEISWTVLADPEGNEFCAFAD